MKSLKKTSPAQRRPAPKASATPSRKRGGGLELEVSAAPAARNYRVRPRPPVMSSNSRSTVVQGHEEIATVNGSVSFAATRYRFNPGLDVYTRLAKVANTFEKYRVRKLEFVYVPAESVTTTPGVVYLAADYDPVDAAPASLAALSTYETQESSRVYEASRLELSRARMFDGVQAKKVRCGPVAGDLQLYDSCSVSVATVSCSGTTAIGQLWVYYDIELISPQTEPAVPIPQSTSIGYNSANQTGVTSGASTVVAFNSFLCNGLEVTPVGGQFTLPCGMYKVAVNLTASDTANESFTVELYIAMDGAVLPVGTYASSSNGSNVAVSVLGYVYSSGTGVLEIQSILTGAAGTLSILSGGQIEISAV